MMKIFATSDIHGYFDIFKEALDKSGFEPDNPNHLLIVCGDYFDRGNQPLEVMNFLMSVPNKVLLRGNHESLLEDLCIRGYPHWNDNSNGTTETVKMLGNFYETNNFENACKQAYNITEDFRQSMLPYYETKNYIFVHSWLPQDMITALPKDDWRNLTLIDWEDAMWKNPFTIADSGFNNTEKWIVHGHFHNSYYWHIVKGKCSEWGEDAIFDTVIDSKSKTIGLDACTAYSGKCNIYVIEDKLLNEE